MNAPLTTFDTETPARTTLADAIFVVINPGSGRKAGQLSLEEMEERLRALPRDTRLEHVKDGTDIGALARTALDEGYGTIVAAGGDGTICAVASELAGEDVTMGVIPMGTFNFFARGLGIPEDVEGAIRVLEDGTPTPVNLGEVNGRIFLNNASLGAYPAILDQREGIYKRWGRSRVAAYWSVLTALLSFKKPLRMQITVDGTRHRRRSALAFVAMSAYQLDTYQLDGADAVRDGRFALYVAPDTGRFGLILQAIRLAGRRMKPGRDVELITGEDILIETNRKRRLLARDGEKETIEDPFHFKVRHDALRILAPHQTGDAAPA
ncbi:diacylglycerol/lipid kinase family protein [Pseudooceanicola sp. LIPI14-2-Ac024]|uniref:diacylglycerol/lipid kinase family protein n=1 Tax=Pseudooceanicola sp. LIPI14-2-Ac024 TaxID=3344875 RepID=UPI0035CF12EF